MYSVLVNIAQWSFSEAITYNIYDSIVLLDRKIRVITNFYKSIIHNVLKLMISVMVIFWFSTYFVTTKQGLEPI